jgi:putative ABC transport system permease protein
VLNNTVGPNHFATLKIPLLAGREFNEGDDRTGAPKVVIINQAFAKRFFPGGDPLGKRIVRGSGDARYEVVGVVGDVKYSGLASEAGSQLYFPYATQPITGGYFMMRTRTDPRTMYDAVRKAVYAVDSEQPVRGLRTMDEVLYDSLSQQRFIMFLLNFFAGLALLLTAVGLYGLIAYSVTQRTHEMGIRMALGAKPRNVLMLVLNYGLKLAVVGTVLGLLAAFAGTRLISSLLYGVSATSPLIFVGASLALLAVALLACLIPARRASRVPPIIALREE